jgi:hypothetical protein
LLKEMIYTFAILADVPCEASIVTMIRNHRGTGMPSALTGVPPFPAVAIKSLQFMSQESGQLRALNELIAMDAALSRGNCASREFTAL